VPGKPLLVWDSVLHDWGRRLANGDKIVGTFTFRNEGDTDLTITKVLPSCGCTAIDGYDKVLSPGQRGKLEFAIDPSRVKSGGAKSIRVSSNCPARKMSLLTMKGEIYHLIEIKPAPRVTFGAVNKGRRSSKVLDLIAKTDQPVEIRKVTSDTSVFKADVQTITEGRQFRMTVVATPPFAPGKNAGKLTIHTNLEEQPTITLPVTANLRPRVQVSPRKLAVRSNATRRLERVLRMVNTGDTPVEITKVTSSDPALKTVVGERTVGGARRVHVSIPEGYTVPEGGAVVTLTTNDAEYKTIEIPVVVRQARALERQSRVARPRFRRAMQTRPAAPKRDAPAREGK